MICPCCQSDMKKGFVEAEGSFGILWVEANRKRSLASKMNNSECIILAEEKVFFQRKSRAEANYCENCKKIIIDVDYKNIFL